MKRTCTMYSMRPPPHPHTSCGQGPLSHFVTTILGTDSTHQDSRMRKWNGKRLFLEKSPTIASKKGITSCPGLHEHGLGAVILPNSSCIPTPGGTQDFKAELYYKVMGWAAHRGATTHSQPPRWAHPGFLWGQEGQHSTQLCRGWCTRSAPKRLWWVSRTPSSFLAFSFCNCFTFLI